MFIISSANSLVLLTLWMDLPTGVLSIVASSLTTPYITDSLLKQWAKG